MEYNAAKFISLETGKWQVRIQAKYSPLNTADTNFKYIYIYIYSGKKEGLSEYILILRMVISKDVKGMVNGGYFPTSTYFSVLNQFSVINTFYP